MSKTSMFLSRSLLPIRKKRSFDTSLKIQRGITSFFLLFSLLFFSPVYASQIDIDFYHEPLSNVTSFVTKFTGFSFFISPDLISFPVTWSQLQIDPKNISSRFVDLLTAQGLTVQSFGDSFSISSAEIEGKQNDQIGVFYKTKYMNTEAFQAAFETVNPGFSVFAITDQVVYIKGTDLNVHDFLSKIEQVDFLESKVFSYVLENQSCESLTTAISSSSLAKSEDVSFSCSFGRVIAVGRASSVDYISKFTRASDDPLTLASARYALNTAQVPAAQSFVALKYPALSLTVDTSALLLTGSPKNLTSALFDLREIFPLVSVQLRAYVLFLTSSDASTLGTSLSGGSGDLSLLASAPDGIGAYLFSKSASRLFSVEFEATTAKTKSRVVSSPSLVCRSGESASLTVGQNIPLLTQTLTDSSSTNITSSITRQDIGLTLRFQPVFDTRTGKISLSVSNSLSSLSGNVQDSSDIVYDNQNVTTVFSLSPGQSVAIGGLHSSSTASASSGVPFLSDIPFIGSLFGSKGQDSQNRELTVVITADILTD